MERHYVVPLCLTAAIATLFLCRIETASSATFTAKDPGVRGGPASAGNPLSGLTDNELIFFDASKDDFEEVEGVSDGLGPTMNLDSCGGCHSQPAFGGSSPSTNPQFAFATTNHLSIPSFIKPNGPVREARFKENPNGSPDGGVHALFTIKGLPGATGCNLQPPNFAAEDPNNVIFRIPTPVFGAGLIEQIPDSAIRANQAANASAKQALGIKGRPNIVLAGSAISGQPNFNGNDGTAARFGWKAQNKSLLLFSGEAYNVEMGITNELFQTERDETPACQFATTPNDVVNTNPATPAVAALSAIEKFALFMRFLAPPKPSSTTPGGMDSITAGRAVFSNIGCDQCHTQKFTTGSSTVAALSNKPVNLFSDLLIHDMGPGLADGISQGQAGPSEFRTAPLWGLGQRIFFLHDGRTSDLVQAIQEHKSGSTSSNNASEANTVVWKYNNLSEYSKQNLLNFLRSL